jgi:hypothetical protein
VGALEVDPRMPGSLEDFLARADKSMYVEKLGHTHAET